MYGTPFLLIERGLALVNFLALASIFRQYAGLLGKNGITPARANMDRIRARFTSKDGQMDRRAGFLSYPTMAWLSCDDRVLQAAMALAMVANCAAFFGILPAVMFAYSVFVYNSIKIIASPWMGLQMHVTIVESNAVYLLGAPFKHLNPFVTVAMFRILSWRVMLGCGACKYGSRDIAWRQLTAMDYHYWSQPLPNPLSALMHRLPHSVHKWEVIATHLIEGPLSFLAFGNAWCRVAAFACFVGLNLGINVTGNFGFLGFLTTVQCFSLLDDEVLRLVLPTSLLPYALRPEGALLSPPVLGLVYLASAIVILSYFLFSLPVLVDTFHGTVPFLEEAQAFLASRSRFLARLLRAEGRWRLQLWWDRLGSVTWACAFWEFLERGAGILQHYHLVNRYAKFGTMTKARFELVIEGSNDGASWQPYEFRYKPGAVSRRPPVVHWPVPGHMPELDWRLWFLPTGVFRMGADALEPWFHALLLSLLEGRKDVLALFAANPFSEAPPKFLRVLLYDYRYPGQPFDNPSVRPASPRSHDRRAAAAAQGEVGPEELGRWWKRRLVRYVCGPLALRAPARAGAPSAQPAAGSERQSAIT